MNSKFIFPLVLFAVLNQAMPNGEIFSKSLNLSSGSINMVGGAIQAETLNLNTKKGHIENIKILKESNIKVAGGEATDSLLIENGSLAKTFLKAGNTKIEFKNIQFIGGLEILQLPNEEPARVILGEGVVVLENIIVKSSKINLDASNATIGGQIIYENEALTEEKTEATPKWAYKNLDPKETARLNALEKEELILEYQKFLQKHSHAVNHDAFKDFKTNITCFFAGNIPQKIDPKVYNNSDNFCQASNFGKLDNEMQCPKLALAKQALIDNYKFTEEDFAKIPKLVQPKTSLLQAALLSAALVAFSSSLVVISACSAIKKVPSKKTLKFVGVVDFVLWLALTGFLWKSEKINDGTGTF